MAQIINISSRKAYVSDATQEISDVPAWRRLLKKFTRDRRRKQVPPSTVAIKRNSAMVRFQNAQSLRAAAIEKFEKKYEEEILSECFTATDAEESDRYEIGKDLPENDADMEAQFMEKFRPYYMKKGWFRSDENAARSMPNLQTRPSNA